MRNILIFPFVALIAISCSGQEATKPTVKSSEVRLVNENEPGTPFTLEILVLDLNSRKPITDAQVFAYHTNSKGDYERNSKDVARIHGTAYSDANGKIRFITIYPRGYNDSPTGEHIHFTAKANGYKEGNKELMFSDGKGVPANPQPGRVYLQSLEDKSGKLEGKATLFMVKN